MSEARGVSVIVEARSLHKDYHDAGRVIHVLRGLRISVEKGELVSVVGKSGAGKSTLLHLLGLLDSPTSGEIFLDGKPTQTMSHSERASLRSSLVGFVFQAYHLMREFTAVENVMMPAMIGGKMGRREARGRAMELLDRVGLCERADYKPWKLSGGEKQRVAIARALANSPEVVLCDEPTGNLDPSTGEEVHDLLVELNRERGTTGIIVTHDAALAGSSDRVLRLGNGTIRREEV